MGVLCTSDETEGREPRLGVSAGSKVGLGETSLGTGGATVMPVSSDWQAMAAGTERTEDLEALAAATVANDVTF